MKEHFIIDGGTKIKEIVNKKSNIVEVALKKEIVRDIFEAGHIKTSINLDDGASKDKMKSKKHTTKHSELRSIL